VGKNKLQRWAELETFSNVIQPDISMSAGNDHPLKGNWGKVIFRNDNPLVLELACGKAEYTTGLSRLFPESNFIGVDIKGSRIWRGAKTASEKGINNSAFLRTRIEFIDSFFSQDEIAEIWIVFPDPQPGKKNSNKRLTCPFFLNKYRNILTNKGIIHLKTDNEELYRYTLKLVTDNSLEILHSTRDMEQMRSLKIPVPTSLYEFPSDDKYVDTISSEILSIRTHYESKFIEQGLKINYLSFRLEKEKNISYGWETEI
jgi:tRNA (guanine-N7-)-methyltransferase